MGGHGGRPSGYVLEISSLAEALLDDAKGCVDSAKLTERLTLKVYALGANNQLQKTDRMIKNFWFFWGALGSERDGAKPVRCLSDAPSPSRASPAPTGIFSEHKRGVHNQLLWE